MLQQQRGPKLQLIELAERIKQRSSGKASATIMIYIPNIVGKVLEK